MAAIFKQLKYNSLHHLQTILILAVIFTNCGNNSQKGSNIFNPTDGTTAEAATNIATGTENKAIANGTIKYAKYFSIYEESGEKERLSKEREATANTSGVKKLVVKNTWNGEAKDDVYTLVPRDCTKNLSGNIYAIPYPVKSVVCMSSSHVAYLTELGEENCIKGISGTRFINNEKVKELIKQKRIEDVGGETLPNYELIIAMKPDVVIAYGILGSNNSHIEKLQKFGVKVLTIGDYLENSPLGKLEYLKLFGELTDKKELADSIFTYKEGKYLELKNKIAQALQNSNSTTASGSEYSNNSTALKTAQSRATITKVLINAPFKGTWYIPGKESYTAQLIQDAGGMILGAKDGEDGAAQLSFEQVYQYALQADVWLHPNAISSLNALAAEHPLFKNIPALQNGKVYNNTLRTTPEGGSDFWETGVVEPHIILQDLAGILNPQLIPTAPELKYYQQLK